MKMGAWFERKKGFTWKTAYLLLALLALCLAARAFCGIDATDESFYFALARRFAQGDAILADEWFPAQLIGILLLPFYRFYVGLFGGQEGLILCTRLCYAAFAVLTAAFMMHVFRKRGEPASFGCPAAMLFAVYARAGIANFSYYNLGLLSFLLALLLLLDGKSARRLWTRQIPAGICLSVSVLCMPYMAVVFVCMAGVYLFRRRSLTPGKDGLCFLLGIFCSAGVFLLFYGREIADGIGNLPYLFMDPLHQGGVLEKTAGTAAYVLFTYLKFTWPLYLFTFAAAAAIRFRRIQNRKVLRAARSLFYLEFFLQAIYSRTFFEGGIVCAFLLLALQIQLVNRGIRDRELEWYFLLPGLLFGLVWSYGSDLGMRVFNMGFCLADVWALKILALDVRTEAERFRYAMRLSAAVLFAVLLANRMLDVYRESPVWELDTRVACGTMKGLFTSAERAREYEAVVQDLRRYTEETDRLVVGGLNPWVYLEAPARCGAFTVWTVDFEDERNWNYYEQYPENRPTVIYLLDTQRTVYEGWSWGSHGSSTQGEGRSQAEGYLKEYLEEHPHEIVRTETGIFYLF